MAMEKFVYASVIVFAVICFVVAVVFPKFWLSGWGVATLITFLFVAVSLVCSWRGKTKPSAPLFGIACGSVVALGLVTTLFTNAVVGGLVGSGLLYAVAKSRFFL